VGRAQLPPPGRVPSAPAGSRRKPEPADKKAREGGWVSPLGGTLMERRPEAVVTRGRLGWGDPRGETKAGDARHEHGSNH